MQYGGVYADMDVECLKPVDEWNAGHGHDAAVLLGLENFDPKRKPHKAHITNWAMAAAPGHPLLGMMPGVVTREIQKQYFALAQQWGELTGKLYEQGILDRTGPAALTVAMYQYFNSIGFDLNKLTAASFDSLQGVGAGGVRVLPIVALSTGWEVAYARSKGTGYTCADVARDKPEALVCHMFWGSWRKSVPWKFQQAFTYDNC
jgi:alpha 1,6-mannosyltransferase